MNQAYVLK